MARYFYSDRSGYPKGPVDVAELKRLLKAGVLTVGSNVAQEGINEWGNIRAVLPDLASAADTSYAHASQTADATALDFPALKIVAGIYKVIALVAFVVGAIGVSALLASQASPMAVMAAVYTLLTPLFLWAGGELILVFLSIEQNTRRTAELLSRRSRGGRAEPTHPPAPAAGCVPSEKSSPPAQ